MEGEGCPSAGVNAQPQGAAYSSSMPGMESLRGMINIAVEAALKARDIPVPPIGPRLEVNDTLEIMWISRVALCKVLI